MESKAQLSSPEVDVLALPTVHNTAPPVEDEPTDPTEAVLASLRHNWMMLPMAYNTKPTSYTGVRTVLLRAEPSAAELTPAPEPEPQEAPPSSLLQSFRRSAP